MPILEFVCEDCGEEFQDFIKSGCQTPVIHCPVCESQRILSTLFILPTGKSFNGAAERKAAGGINYRWNNLSVDPCRTGST